MLKSLYISSFVIIDEMRVDFENGMSVLTGETGAGKSIIIDALGQLCGNRASTSLIKKGCSKAIVEGIFDTDTTEVFLNLLDEFHIPQDEEYVITKEIQDNGKSVVKINYQTTSTTVLKKLMPYFIDIHSQFETQKLFAEKNHIHLLDEYGNKDLNPLLHEYADMYSSYKSLNRQLERAVHEDLSDEQLEFLQSQYDEIDQVDCSDEDVEELEIELKLLQNHEKLNEHIQLYQQHMSQVTTQLKDALNQLDHILEYGDFQTAYDNIYNYYYNLIDENENILDTYHSYHFDEYRFNEVQELLFQVNRLKRKYGLTMERVYEYKDELQAKIEHIHHRDDYIQDLTKQVREAKEKCLKQAKIIHQKRCECALAFEKDIHLQLKDLYLEKATFKVQISETELQPHGIDKVQFMVSINQGQNLSLLNETASGGEISRIMLAIKTIILIYQNVETIVFDEVDTGVSGKVASRIGKKMHQLSSNKQIICITHLPQVASLADHQYSIEKTSLDEETISSIRLLNQDERIKEIAKMLSGTHITQEAIENAKQLLHV